MPDLRLSRREPRRNRVRLAVPAEFVCMRQGWCPGSARWLRSGQGRMCDLYGEAGVVRARFEQAEVVADVAGDRGWVAVDALADFEVFAAGEQAEQARAEHFPGVLCLALEQSRQLAHLAFGVVDGALDAARRRNRAKRACTVGEFRLAHGPADDLRRAGVLESDILDFVGKALAELPLDPIAELVFDRGRERLREGR